jgi:hypothetical protein
MIRNLFTFINTLDLKVKPWGIFWCLCTLSILYYYDLLYDILNISSINIFFGLFIGIYSIRLLFRESISIVDDLTTTIVYHKYYKTLAYLLATYTGYLLMYYLFNILIYYMPFLYYPLKIINILVLLNFYISYHIWENHDFNSNLFLFNVGREIVIQYRKNRKFCEFIINDVFISNFKFFGDNFDENYIRSMIIKN